MVTQLILKNGLHDNYWSSSPKEAFWFSGFFLFPFPIFFSTICTVLPRQIWMYIFRLSAEFRLSLSSDFYVIGWVKIGKHSIARTDVLN